MMEVVLCGRGTEQEQLLVHLPEEPERLDARLREAGIAMEDVEICSVHCVAGGMDRLLAGVRGVEVLNALAQRLWTLPVADLRILAGLCEIEPGLQPEEFICYLKRLEEGETAEPVLWVEVYAGGETEDVTDELVDLPASAQRIAELLYRLGAADESEVSVCFYKSEHRELDEYLWQLAETHGELGTVSEWNALAQTLGGLSKRGWVLLAAALTRKSAPPLSLSELANLAARFAER